MMSRKMNAQSCGFRRDLPGAASFELLERPSEGGATVLFIGGFAIVFRALRSRRAPYGRPSRTVEQRGGRRIECGRLCESKPEGHPSKQLAVLRARTWTVRRLASRGMCRRLRC